MTPPPDKYPPTPAADQSRDLQKIPRSLPVRLARLPVAAAVLCLQAVGPLIKNIGGYFLLISSCILAVVLFPLARLGLDQASSKHGGEYHELYMAIWYGFQELWERTNG